MHQENVAKYKDFKVHQENVAKIMNVGLLFCYENEYVCYITVLSKYLKCNANIFYRIKAFWALATPLNMTKHYKNNFKTNI